MAVASALVVVVVLGCLALYVRWRVRWHRALRQCGGYPFPLALPVIGNLLLILGPMSTIFERGLRIFRHLAKTDPGNRICFWLGEQPVVHLMRPEDLECLLSSSRQTDKPEIVYRTVSGFFGRGLITLSGKAWHHHRRVLTPAFHFAVLERYSGVFARRAGDFASRLAALPQVQDGQSFDFMPHISTFVTDTVMETAFGLQEDHNKGELLARRDFARAAVNAFQIIAHRVMKPWLMVDTLFRWSPLWSKQVEIERIINQYASQVITLKREELRRARESGFVEEDDKSDVIGLRRKDTFLDLVLNQAELLSDEEIVQEVRTLIAVQQTSASTLGFLVVCLALHPEVQRAAREEVLRVDAEPGLAPLERLNRLKYVERVVKETMRLFPITALFSRCLTEDLLLPAVKTDDAELPPVTLPAGLIVSMFVYQTHRDPRHWPEAERFDPDRFLPERSVGRHPYAYVPFSAGPRNCIGQRYAMLQMKAVTAALLRAMELRPGDNCESLDKLPVNMNTFLYIRGGANVRAFRRGCG